LFDEKTRGRKSRDRVEIILTQNFTLLSNLHIRLFGFVFPSFLLLLLLPDPDPIPLPHFVYGPRRQPKADPMWIWIQSRNTEAKYTKKTLNVADAQINTVGYRNILWL
jgi:hypothetical protein